MSAFKVNLGQHAEFTAILHYRRESLDGIVVQNNPVNYVDPSGLAPGDSYPTPRDAGRQAIIDINPTSIKQGKEYGGVIYTKPNGSSSYTAPVPGGQAGVIIPFNTSPPATGWYHTHGANDPGYDNENFSSADLNISNSRNIPGYLGTPSGAIKEYTSGRESSWK